MVIPKNNKTATTRPELKHNFILDINATSGTDYDKPVPLGQAPCGRLATSGTIGALYPQITTCFALEQILSYDERMRLIALLTLAVTMASADTIKIFGREWTVRVASDWKVDQQDGVPVLRLIQNRGPLLGPRRPIQFTLSDVENYARLTVEADLKPLGRSLLIVFAYRDEAHFNYAHLSTDTAAKQPVHNGIFHVYGGERVRISPETGPAAFEASGRWYHVRLTHDGATGTVSVTVDGRRVPALEAVDRSLGPGKVGFGSFDETGEFKNVKIVTNPASHSTR